MKILGLLTLALLIILTGAWETLAIIYTAHTATIFHYGFAIVFGLITLSSVILLRFRRWRWWALLVFTLASILFLVWYSSIKPSNDRDWQTDVERLSYATQKENLVTVYNIRNFRYRTEMDYTPAYYDKTFDLDKIKGVDVIAVYWMGPAIAHIFLSFSFEEGEHLAISIESRKEKGEEYSTVKGFFRQYELYYVVADERDVIGLRTNYRFDPTENVYLFPMSGTIKDARLLFLDYVKNMNELKTTPKFYNTLTTNCTTTIWKNSANIVGRIPMSWKILISGYVPQYLYENGRLHTDGLSFKELKEKSHINARALKAGIVKDFSYKIRENLDTKSI